MKTINLGIVAHVDAGKTTLTERLLYAAGVVDTPGSVDDGTTRTDSLDLERRRGITIRSAVVSFEIAGATVNLIDTPGHPDFIAEVERVLGVLDGAVLVISAVEGVQSQTRILMRALHRLGIPTLVFVNKIDRGGARDLGVLREITDRLGAPAVAMGTTTGLGTRAAGVHSCSPGHPDVRTALLDALADRDDALLAEFLADEQAITASRLRTALVGQVRRGGVLPVFFGSARTGAGVDDLAAAVADLLPGAAQDGDGSLAATVFKIDRGPAGERVSYLRMFGGTLRTRDRIELPGGRSGRVTGIAVFEGGAAERRDSIAAGSIGTVWGLDSARIGDVIGTPPRGVVHEFPPPSLETVVVPVRAGDAGRLHTALTRLAEQDPLIGLRHDEVRREISVSLYGEVQKEVIQSTLAEGFGVDVAFRPSRPVCIERVLGVGSAVEFKGAPNPFLATVGLRIGPGAVGSGVRFDLAVELGSMPPAFFRAVEESVRVMLRQGLCGWEIPDCAVTMTHSGYFPRQSAMHATFDKSMSSTGRDFRQLTPLVVVDALRRAGTQVCEPIHRFRLEIPADAVDVVLVALGQHGAVVAAPGSVERAALVLEGEIPAARVHELRGMLPGLTGGEAVLETEFARHVPARGAPPSRPRTDDDPLHREEYLLRVQRRVLRGA